MDPPALFPMGCLDDYPGKRPGHLATVVLAELVPARWRHHLMHTRAAFLIKTARVFKARMVVTAVTRHLGRG